MKFYFSVEFYLFIIFFIEMSEELFKIDNELSIQDLMLMKRFYGRPRTSGRFDFECWFVNSLFS